jgi:phosphoribosylformylglycinamidine synthase
LGVAMAECCVMNQESPLGANFELWPYHRADFALFGESQSMIVVSYDPIYRGAVAQICQKHDVPFTVIGNVGGDALRIPELLEISLAEIAEGYYTAIEKMMERW